MLHSQSVALPKTKSAHGERRQGGKNDSVPRRRAVKVHRLGRPRQRSSKGHKNSERSQYDTDDTAQSTSSSGPRNQKTEVDHPLSIDDARMYSDEWSDDHLATSAAKSNDNPEKSATKAAKPAKAPKPPPRLKPSPKRTVDEPSPAENVIRGFKGYGSKSRAEHHNAVQDHRAKIEPLASLSSTTSDADTRDEELSRIPRSDTKDAVKTAARVIAMKGEVQTEELSNEDLMAEEKVTVVDVGHE